MRTSKTTKSSASTWRKRDKKYRDQEKARRAANAKRREEVATAAARGISVEQLRSEATGA